MSSSPNADALIDAMGGQDIELNHRFVDDPINILQGNAHANNTSSLISTLRSKVSFLSLNISCVNREHTSCKDCEYFSFQYQWQVWIRSQL